VNSKFQSTATSTLIVKEIPVLDFDRFARKVEQRAFDLEGYTFHQLH
jgi:hypothetical protein